MAQIVVPCVTGGACVSASPDATDANGSWPSDRSNATKSVLPWLRSLTTPCARSAGSLAALLDVGPDELLGVLVEDLVDLVEEVVELRLDLVGALGIGRRDLLDGLVLAGGRRPFLLFTFCHGHPSPDGRNHPARYNSSLGL